MQDFNTRRTLNFLMSSSGCHSDDGYTYYRSYDGVRTIALRSDERKCVINCFGTSVWGLGFRAEFLIENSVYLSIASKEH